MIIFATRNVIVLAGLPPSCLRIPHLQQRHQGLAQQAPETPGGCREVHLVDERHGDGAIAAAM
uniref:Uncharacterized protein n=1 Tax=Arundo donax TaxID=35708 RepID=A0A0A8Y048_ARUDO